MVIEFIWQWWCTRSIKAICLALPSVIVMVIAFSICIYDVPDEKLVSRYQTAAAQSIEAEDWDEANLYYRRIMQLTPNDRDVLFSLALVNDERGDSASALSIMQRLAPQSGDIGYARAHLWLAKRMLKNAKTPIDPLLAKSAEHHLTAAESIPKSTEAAHIHINLKIALGDIAGAIEKLEQIVGKERSLYNLLGGLYSRTGQFEKSERAYEGAKRHFQALLGSEPNSIGAILGLAEANLNLKDHLAAARVLQEALKLSSVTEQQGQQVREALAIVIRSKYDEITQKSPLDFQKRLRLLEQGLVYTPNNPTILRRLAQFSVEDQTSDEAKQRLNTLLASGQTPAIVHFVLGTAAVGQDDQKAQHHLEIASKMLPQAFAATNNLAWTLAHQDEPNLERALTLIDVAVKQRPKHPEVRETRGTILQKMGKTTEAIKELEIALQFFPDRPSIHQKLGDLYTKLGETEIAEQHMALSDAF